MVEISFRFQKRELAAGELAERPGTFRGIKRKRTHVLVVKTGCDTKTKVKKLLKFTCPVVAEYHPEYHVIF